MTLKNYSIIFALIALTSILLLGANHSFAADHGDAPLVSNDQGADIADGAASLFPSWFNNNLQWYLEGSIDEKTLANAFKDLADREIIILDPGRADIVRDLKDENMKLKQQIGGDPPPEPGIVVRPVPGALPELPGFPQGCPDNYSPVCGRDGHTYPNECVADKAGAGIAHDGECRDECRANTECSFGMVCRDGSCQAPCDIACIQYDPVCGTDGKTYACGKADASCYGVDVAYDGECKERPYDQCPSGHTWIECAGLCVQLETDVACPDGTTWISSLRQCVPDDDKVQCPQLYDPVCGVDGKTYGNSCEAKRDSVEVAYEGKCTDEVACPEIYAPVCGVDGKTYGNSCEAQRDRVDVAYEGECTADVVCPKVYDPVCGADGNTYDNSCYANAANVEIAHDGECQALRAAPVQ